MAELHEGIQREEELPLAEVVPTSPREEAIVRNEIELARLEEAIKRLMEQGVVGHQDDTLEPSQLVGEGEDNLLAKVTTAAQAERVKLTEELGRLEVERDHIKDELETLKQEA